MKKIFSIFSLMLMTAVGAMAQTYNVTVKEGTEDAANWSATPNPAEAGQNVTITYSGTKKVKSIKAVKKTAAIPAVTYTELKGGEVLHVGDIIDIADENARYFINNGTTFSKSHGPYTVMRANITGDGFMTPYTVTPAADGAYYVLQGNEDRYYFYNSSRLPVTATSDGISVTKGSENGNLKNFTFTVHEP